MSNNLQTLDPASPRGYAGTSSMAAASAACACPGLCLDLPDEMKAELAALAQVHTGGNVNRMALILLARQLRPTEFEMAGAA